MLISETQIHILPKIKQIHKIKKKIENKKEQTKALSDKEDTNELRIRLACII